MGKLLAMNIGRKSASRQAHNWYSVAKVDAGRLICQGKPTGNWSIYSTVYTKWHQNVALSSSEMVVLYQLSGWHLLGSLALYIYTQQLCIYIYTNAHYFVLVFHWNLKSALVSQFPLQAWVK